MSVNICACLIGRKKNVVLLTGDNLVLPVKKDFYNDNSLHLFSGVSARFRQKKNKVNYIENGIKSYLLKNFVKKKIINNKNFSFSFSYIVHCLYNRLNRHHRLDK